MIRRLLRKSHSDQVKQNIFVDETDREVNVFNSDPEINQQEDESEPPMEISISVPNLSELSMARPQVLQITMKKKRTKVSE